MLTVSSNLQRDNPTFKNKARGPRTGYIHNMSDEALLAPASESAWAVSVDNDTALSPDEPEWASSMDKMMHQKRKNTRDTYSGIAATLDVQY